MLFVEFAGCPGVGKSTICSNVIDVLRDNGIKTMDILRDETKLNKLRRSIFVLSYKADKSNVLLRKELNKYVERHPSSSSIRFALEIQKTAFKIHTKKYLMQEIVFQNEGPTQFLTSIAFDKAITSDLDESLVEAINTSIYDKNYVILVHVTCDQEEIINRLITRGNTNDRYSSQDRTELSRLLSVKEENINIVKQLCHYSHIITVENYDIHTATREVSDTIMACIEKETPNETCYETII